jgi:hypothetical protein
VVQGLRVLKVQVLKELLEPELRLTVARMTTMSSMLTSKKFKIKMDNIGRSLMRPSGFIESIQ